VDIAQSELLNKESESKDFNFQNPSELLPDSLGDIFNYAREVDRSDFFTRFLDQMFAEMAPQVFAELEALPASKRKSQMLSQFFEKWGQLSGKEAFEYAMDYPGEDGRSFQGYAAEGWSLAQPVEAWNALLEISNSGSVFISRMGPTIGRIAQADMGLAMELIGSIRDNGRQQFFFKSIIASASEMNQMPGLLSELSFVEDTKQQGALAELLFREWGKVDSDLSMEAINTLEDTSMVESAMKGMMLGWAAQDGRSALEYAIQNSEDPLFEKLSQTIASEWSRYATAEDVGEILSTIETSGIRDKILNNVFYTLARANPYAAMDWVENNPNAEKRTQMTAFLISNIGSADFEAAKTMFQNLPNDKERLELSFSMVNNSIRNGDTAEDTLKLLDAYETEEMRDRGLRNIISVASQKENLKNSVELRSVLYEHVQSSKKYNDEMRKFLLKRLFPE
jgi:hypothetical protein